IEPRVDRGAPRSADAVELRQDVDQARDPRAARAIERCFGGLGRAHAVLAVARPSCRGGATMREGDPHLARHRPLESADLGAGRRRLAAQIRLGALLAVPDRERDLDLAARDRLVAVLAAVEAAEGRIRYDSRAVREIGLAVQAIALGACRGEI